MNISSLSSSSVSWEEYLEQLREKKRQQGETEAAAFMENAEKTAVTVDIQDILSQLEELEDDPEALKVKAAELAETVSEAAGSASGPQSKMLQEIASDLSSVAESGDLSVITDKMKAHKPSIPMNAGISGLSGASGASMKWLEALLTEENEETSETSSAAVVAKATEAETAAEEETTTEFSIEELMKSVQLSFMNQISKIYSQSQVNGVSALNIVA